MSFISYAQNFEDVMLYRALKDIECGFYIDVGAGDPTDLSVTRAFYGRGWRGINIEPMQQWFRRLEEQRPEDVNLQLAVSRETGSSRFFEVVDTGLSTLIDNVARRHEEQGHEIRAYDVPTTTLDAVIDEYGGGEIHFLKIDVEGAEKEVLASIDFDKTRPWVVVVEAMEPLSQVPTYERWNSRLLDHNYDAVYFDGLNQFFLGNEHSERRDAFHAPPNVLDGFVRYREWSLGRRVEEIRSELLKERDEKERLKHARQNLESELLVEREVKESMASELTKERETKKKLQHTRQNLESELLAECGAKKGVESELAGTKEEIKRLTSELAAVHASWSWRITINWPLRAPLEFVIWLYHTSKHVVRLLVMKSVNFIIERPRLTARLSALLDHLPGLRTRLNTLLSAGFHAQGNRKEWHEASDQASESAYDLSTLSEAARKVYWDLEMTADRRNREEDGCGS